MVMSLDSERLLATERLVAEQDDRAYTYRIYGLRVRSAIPLPAAPARMARQMPAQPEDILVHLRHREEMLAPDGPMRAWVPCPIHGADLRVHRGPGGAWFWHHAVGTLHVSADDRTIDIYPENGADERALGHAVLQPALLHILNRRRQPNLHAGAVLTCFGVAAFLGESGQGKSTLTATFLKHGAALFSDDALPLRTRGAVVRALPGPPHMKLWQETARRTLTLDVGGLPDLTAACDKKLLALDSHEGRRFARARRGAALRALYLLDRYDPAAAGRDKVTIQTLSPREALAALVTHTSGRDYLLPAEEAPILPIYARVAARVPVRLLSYPSGFEYVDDVCSTILADLEGA